MIRASQPQQSNSYLRVWNVVIVVILSLITIAVAMVLIGELTPGIKVVIAGLLEQTGYAGEDIKISGTGSMYPMFPKGKGITDIARANEIVALSKMRRYPGGILLGSYRFFQNEIHKGDVVSFQNKKTNEISQRQFGEDSGFVKRVVGLPGDLIEIRDGFVFVGGVRIRESYTARARSTFGGTTIPDCEPFRVPSESLFVLGDNRTGSNDSRYDLGFVEITDVDHILFFTDQKEYAAVWRDASHDDELLTQPTLDAKEYVMLLNERRKDAGIPLLRLDEKLSLSAKKRGEVILKYNDLSFEATKSAYTMVKAMEAVGYTNTTWGEAPALGYYTAEELIENNFQFAGSRKFLLNHEFQDIGVAAVLGEINGCPAQVIVSHIAGYVPPNYSKEIIENWERALKVLRDVRPGWADLRSYEKFYQEHKSDVDRLLVIIDTRITRLTAIVERMNRNEWLTKEEQRFADDDKHLYEEQEQLASKLNKQ